MRHLQGKQGACMRGGCQGGAGGFRRLAGSVFLLVACSAFLMLACGVLFPANRAFAADDESNLVDPTQRADNSFIYDTTIGSLFNQSSLYEERTVQIVGEVIGDRIDATEPDMYWITLTSVDEEDKTSISCLLTTEQANQIDQYGRYGVTGTRLQVRGTYHQACLEHDGLPDIHATNSSVLQRGNEHPDQFKLDEFLPGIVTVLIGGLLMGAFYIARERMR